MSLKPADIHALREISSPSLSADGSTLIYVQVNTCENKKTSPSCLMLYPIQQNHARQFTAGPKDASPQYAPDGEVVGFLRPGSDGGKSQLWLISTAAGEAYQLTDLPGGVREFAWAPDSTRLAIISRLDPDADAADETDVPKTQVARRIRYRDDGDGWRGDAFSQLFVVDINGDAARQLTDAEGDHLAPVWSPAGDRIAYISDAVEDRDSSKHSEVCVIPAAGGDAESWSATLRRANSVAWSPDGKRLVAVGSHDPDVWDARQSWLYILEAGAPYRIIAGESHTVVPPLPQHCWTSDDQLIYIADQAGQSFLCRTPARGGDQEIIAGGGKTFTSLVLDEENKQAAVVATATDVAGDIYLIDLYSSSERYLTSVNGEFLQTHPAAPVEKFSLQRNGWNIETRLLFPPDFDAAKQYPLVLDIHGGPNGRFSDSYDIAQQLLSNAGYLGGVNI
jgi:dipeptidyl aminopeptidase/acylaminoacyl peptidase